MKKLLPVLSICTLFNAAYTNAQCPAGYNQVTLNWDDLDYFTYTGNYTSANGYLSSNALSRTQNFAFGTQRLTITHNFNDANSLGENGNHTGEAGSYGTGDDINFNGNGPITFTFENEVQNLKFSIYDLDNSQGVNITATNAASVAQTVTLSKANAASAMVIVGGSVTTALVGNQSTSSDRATVNVDIAGPVKTVTLNFNGTSGDFWISDITACSAGNFTANYYNVSKPFTGQASYVLISLDKSVYAVNVATGFSRLLFTDATGLGNINSMAYDPYKRILYYVYSLTGSPATNRILKKYDFNTGTISTVLSDIASTTYGTGVGIPTTTFAGVESGGAAFYDGSLYLGIECSNSSRNSGREAVIWRIDFDASNVPYRASQMFATPSDNGSGTLVHDWADFGIIDGILYDFDGAGGAGSSQTDIYQHNMITGATTLYADPAITAALGNWVPGQISVGWDNKVYQLYAANASGSSNDVSPEIALYNGNGTIGAATTLTAVPAIQFPDPPSLGDAAEAFRYPVDFGDAPATFDPSGSDPAVHELSANLYLGTNKDEEVVSRGQTALANADNFDDGLPTVNIFNPNYANYLTQVNVFNNTGANATVCAWLDYNGDGVFNPSEGITVTVPTSASVQSVYLYWPSAPSSLPIGSNTYLRIRVTSAANGMTTANPTGYYPDGEVEDYRVPVNLYPLDVQLLSFDAQKADRNVHTLWKTVNEPVNTKYELQRSSNLQSWTSIYNKLVPGNTGESNYAQTDNDPLNGISFYRLKIEQPDGSVRYSETRRIEFSNSLSLSLAPNPASSSVKLTLNNDKASTAHLKIVDAAGRVVHKEDLTVQKGANATTLTFVQKLNSGIYSVQLELDGRIFNEKLVIKK